MALASGLAPAVAAQHAMAPVGRVPPALANLPPGALISGTIIGRDGGGNVLFRTVAGTLAMATKFELVRGSVVTLRVREGPGFSLAVHSVDGRTIPGQGVTPVTHSRPASAPDQAPVPAASRNDSLLEISRDWPAFREVMAVLRRIDAGFADRLLQRAIPAPGQNLGAAIVLFLSAVQSGDVAAWLGRDALRLLADHGHKRLADRLAASFGEIARMARGAAPGEWQPFIVPLFDGGAVRQLRLFVRRPPGDDAQSDQGTRFVLEIVLSRLGDVQLDGLVYERRFDLILRSRAAFPDGARQDISNIFNEGLSAAGLVGMIRFQVADVFPVAPLDEIRAGAHSGVLA